MGMRSIEEPNPIAYPGQPYPTLAVNHSKPCENPDVLYSLVHYLLAGIKHAYYLVCASKITSR